MTETTETRTEEVKLDSIVVEEQARKDFGDIKALAASIKRHGLLQPIILEPSNGGYRLVAGHRRLHAMAELGFETLPEGTFTIREFEDAKATAHAQFEENVRRKDFTVDEEADAVQQLLELTGQTAAKFAKVGGYKVQAIENLSLIAKLPAKWRKKHADGSLTTTDAVEAAKMLDAGLPDVEVERATRYQGASSERAIKAWADAEGLRAQVTAVTDLGLKRLEATKQSQYSDRFPDLYRVAQAEPSQQELIGFALDKGFVKMTLDEHRKLDCHRWHLAGYQRNYMIEGCIKPRSHTDAYIGPERAAREPLPEEEVAKRKQVIARNKVMRGGAAALQIKVQVQINNELEEKAVDFLEQQAALVLGDMMDYKVVRLFDGFTKGTAPNAKEARPLGGDNLRRLNPETALLIVGMCAGFRACTQPDVLRFANDMEKAGVEILHKRFESDPSVNAARSWLKAQK